MARQGSGAGTGHIRQHAIKIGLRFEPGCVSSDDLHVCRPNSSSQYLSAMRVQLGSHDGSVGVASGNSGGLASRCGTAVQNSRAAAYEQGNELGCFVLNEDTALAKSAGLRDLALADDSGGSEQFPRN